jgi:hypothetical protein
VGVALALAAGLAAGESGRGPLQGLATGAGGRLVAASSPPAAVAAPGTPAPCPPPPLPAATIPPAPYGIPFVAQISATVLTGYDEYVAAHGVPNNTNPTPWRSSLSNISGWASGLLQVPSLTATITPANLTFCSPGLKPSQGGALIQLLQEQLPGQPPFLPISNNDANCSPSVEGFQDDRVTLTPAGSTTLSVVGTEPDGSLDLAGSTSAVTKIDFYADACGTPPPPVPTQTCVQFAPTTFNLSSKLPPIPATAPPGVVYTVAPRGLQGPLPPPTGQVPPNGASAALVDYSFPVPAFIDSLDGVPGGCFLAAEFNGPLSGFNNNGPSETTRYPTTFSPGAQPQIAAQPGWAEVSTVNKIVAIGSS